MRAIAPYLEFTTAGLGPRCNTITVSPRDDIERVYPVRERRGGYGTY